MGLKLDILTSYTVVIQMLRQGGANAAAQEQATKMAENYNDDQRAQASAVFLYEIIERKKAKKNKNKEDKTQKQNPMLLFVLFF